MSFPNPPFNIPPSGGAVLVPVVRLDNTSIPPTWDGTNPEISDPYTDADTGLRYSVGSDDYNYGTDQRIEGDLFKRDLIAGEGIAALSSFLLANSGFTLISPSVKVMFGKQIVLGTWPVNGSVAYQVTLASLGNASANFILELVDQTSTVQWSLAGNGTPQGWAINAVLPTATSWSLIIKNTASGTSLPYGNSGFLSGTISCIVTPYVAPS
jgi:hypothetical protein